MNHAERSASFTASQPQPVIFDEPLSRICNLSGRPPAICVQPSAAESFQHRVLTVVCSPIFLPPCEMDCYFQIVHPTPGATIAFGLCDDAARGCDQYCLGDRGMPDSIAIVQLRDQVTLRYAGKDQESPFAVGDRPLQLSTNCRVHLRVDRNRLWVAINGQELRCETLTRATICGTLRFAVTLTVPQQVVVVASNEEELNAKVQEAERAIIRFGSLMAARPALPITVWNERDNFSFFESGSANIAVDQSNRVALCIVKEGVATNAVAAVSPPADDDGGGGGASPAPRRLSTVVSREILLADLGESGMTGTQVVCLANFDEADFAVGFFFCERKPNVLPGEYSELFVGLAPYSFGIVCKKNAVTGRTMMTLCRENVQLAPLREFPSHQVPFTFRRVNGVFTCRVSGKDLFPELANMTPFTAPPSSATPAPAWGYRLAVSMAGEGQTAFIGPTFEYTNVFASSAPMQRFFARYQESLLRESLSRIANDQYDPNRRTFRFANILNSIETNTDDMAAFNMSNLTGSVVTRQFFQL